MNDTFIYGISTPSSLDYMSSVEQLDSYSSRIVFQNWVSSKGNPCPASTQTQCSTKDWNIEKT